MKYCILPLMFLFSAIPLPHTMPRTHHNLMSTVYL